MGYFTLEDLQARLGSATVSQIFDDDGTGDPDTAPVALLIADASSKVDSYIGGAYRLPLSSTPNEIKRLALDVAVAMAAQRNPEYIRRNWQDLMAKAEAELASLRDGHTVLATAPGIDQPGNQGGVIAGDEVGEGGVTTTTPKRFFVDGLGDF